MKNILIGVLVVIVLVLGFFFLKDDKSEESNEFFDNDLSSENNNDGGANQGGNQSSNNNNQEEDEYNYENEQLGFSVDLDGVVATQTTRGNITTINFGSPQNSSLPEESRIPNKLSVTVSSDDSIFDDMRAIGESLGNETINGKVFEKYSFSVEGSMSYNYLTSHDGYYYKVSTLNPSNMQEFYLN